MSEQVLVSKVWPDVFFEYIDGERHLEVLETWMPDVKEMFKFTTAWRLQQDNDPVFTYIPARRFLAENHVDLLEWPSNSPDLNPIENLWDRIKREVEKLEPMDLPELEEAIYETFHNLTLEYLQESRQQSGRSTA